MFFYFFVALLALSGCSDYMVAKVVDREAEILVHPGALDFDHLESGKESGIINLTVINVGDDELYVDPPLLYDDDGRYTVADTPAFTLGAGELLDIPVTYTPETFEENIAEIHVYSSDTQEPVVVVPLAGNGDAPVIFVDPLDFDYGTISMGCDNEERITISNEGNLPLEVSSVTQMVTLPEDIVMEFGSLPEPPWYLDPGDQVDFLVSYVPEDTGIDLSEIVISSNDPANPSVVALQEGYGEVERWVTDEFEQEEVPLLDVLWVIDNSGSMGAIQSTVASHIDDFMTVFLAASPDYHMAFITTDSGSFQAGMFIDSGTTTPELVAASIVSTIGVGGNANEKGVQYAYESTSDPLNAGPGGDFFREEATLVVIFVSDEPDHSASGWFSYTTHFSGLKDAGKFHPVSIIGDYPSGCYGTFGAYTRNVQHGAGYYEFTNYYGGQIYSLCAPDWGIQMEDLAETVSTRRTFPLSETDVMEDTVEVYVNSQLVTEGYEYDPVENEVVFEPGKEPDEGDQIEINYALWGC